MKTNVFQTIFGVFIAAVLMITGTAAISAPTNILPVPTQVSEHVYAWIGPHGGPSPENKGFRMNMAFVVGTKAVAVIESGYYEPMSREMLQHIAQITSAPVKYVINSNSQPDRFLGNEYFRRQGATIITSKAEAQRMVAMGSLFADITERALALKPGGIVLPGPADRILEGDTELDLGGVTIALKQFGAAHTPGPLVIHVPKDKVVYGGDILYSGRLPAVIDGSNVKSWIEVFDQLRSFGDVTFVPGHGQAAPLSAFEFSTREYLVMLRTHMLKVIEQEKGLNEAIRSLDQTRFAKLAIFEDLAGRNASFTYLEVEMESFR